MIGGEDKPKSFHQLDTVFEKLVKAKADHETANSENMKKFDRQRKAKHFFVGKRSISNKNRK